MLKTSALALLGATSAYLWGHGRGPKIKREICFERWRGMLAIDSKGLWGSKRRELPLDSIVDITLEEVRGKNTPSYYIYYVTAEGGHILWAGSYDDSKEKTLECFQAAREFLGMADAPAAGFTDRGEERK